MTRIWDRFLTPDDRALDVALPRAVFDGGGPGQKPALLLIDLFRCALGDGPEPVLMAIERDPLNCGLSGWKSIPFTRRLLGEARDQGLPVIHLTQSQEIPQPWRALSSRGRPNNSGEAGDDTRWEIADEVAPIEGELLIAKSSPSGFATTPLASVLQELGIDTLVVAGESTSGCVRATVVDGSARRFRMIVVEECVFDRTEASHAINLYDMHRKYADVLSLEETVLYLRSL